MVRKSFFVPCYNFAYPAHARLQLCLHPLGHGTGSIASSVVVLFQRFISPSIGSFAARSP